MTTEHGNGDQAPASGAEDRQENARAGAAPQEPAGQEESTSKAELLAALADAQAQFDAAIAGLDEAALVEPGVVGDWSVKDLIGHVAAWEQLVIESVAQWRT